MNNSNGSARKNEPDVMKMTAIGDLGKAVEAVAKNIEGLKMVLSHTMLYHADYAGHLLGLKAPDVREVLIEVAKMFDQK